MTQKQGSHNLNPGSGDRNSKPPRTSRSGRRQPSFFAGMSRQGKLLIGILGTVLLVALLWLLIRWVLPNRQDKDTLDSLRELKGVTEAATLIPTAPPEESGSLIEVLSTPQATRAPETEAPVTAAPRVAAATTIPPAAANVPGEVSAGGNGLTTGPKLLDEYLSLYAQNSDMGGWLKVRAIRNIDFPYVRGKNDYYIHHDFYGRESVGGTPFLDETCTDWPRDTNLIIYAHNLKSGEMFGELNRLSSLTTLRSNPFVDFDTLYEKGVYIPVSVYVCSVDPADPTYFNFNLSDFRSAEEFDEYIRRAKELNRVSINVDVAESDDLLTLVTCRDEAGMERFVVLLRRLRADETESSVRNRYFR